MPLRFGKSWRPVGCAIVATLLLAACTLVPPGLTKKRKKTPVDPGDDYYDDVPSGVAPIEPDEVNGSSGAFGNASERPATDASDPTTRPDAGPIDEPDAGGTGIPKKYCAPTLRVGDLAVVEVMISSRSGSNDTGEWVEVQNTQTCWLKLQGLSVESPRGGAAANIATIAEDVDLAPGETFVVADTADAVENHGIGGTVLAWNAADVLKNDGDTVIVKLGDLEIDRVTYPAFDNLTAGRSLAFPANCPWAQRSDWKRWSLAFATYETGFRGTPNSENIDVTCF